MEIVAVEVPHLGNRSHLVHDGRRAIVVDPPRDTRAVEAAAERAEVEITAVADTHIHNDYVSGALGLARRHGADYLLSANEQVDFERVGVRDGDVVPVGGLEVEVVATPGHTRHHQSFLVRPQRPGPHDAPGALLSGGSLLLGTVGRTDLVDPRLARDLAGMQWASAQVLGGLDPATVLLPTHGFGSFCASTTTACTRVGESVTLADQHTVNPALRLDRETFVSELVAGFGPIPRYYRHMAPLNRAGAGRATPRGARPVTATQVTDAVLGGAWVIDLRSRADFATGHLAGSLSVEYGTQFATYVGWIVPWTDDIVVLSDTPELLESALRDLADIGIDDVATHVVSTAAAAGTSLTASYRRTDWAAFAAEAADADAASRVVVDVRQRDEWEAGHLPGAIHLPVQDVETRLGELPDGELWVHCRSGYRAGIASSLLHRHGRAVVHIDDAWDRVAELRLPVTTAVAA